MKIDEALSVVLERLIEAMETDTARPARLKSQSLPFIHTAADQAGWGGERYAEERDSFWEERSTRLKTSDVSDWERANSLIVLVPDESERRCLWHWAIGKAGGRPFKRWCRDEGIHVETGRRRKDRAVSQIALAFIRKPLHNNENGLIALLPAGPEIDHISVNIDEPSHTLTWQDDDAFSPTAVPELRDFSWAEKRNEMRRQREAKKREAA